MRSIAQALLATAPPDGARVAPARQSPARQPQGAGRRLDPALNVAPPRVVAGAVLEPDETHQSACRGPDRGKKFAYGRDCHRCLYLRNESKWHNRARFTCNGEHCSWLWAKPPGSVGPWAVGCVVCARAGVGSAWAKFSVQAPTMSHIAQHANCAGHTAALASYCDDAAPRAGRIPAPGGWLDPARAKAGSHVPSHLEFADALCDLTKKYQAAVAGGLAPPQPPEKRSRDALMDAAAGDAVDRRKKRKKLVYCLAEALRQRHREAIRKACTMTVMEDKKGSCHAVRFACVDAESLEVHRGAIGLEECCSNSAEASAKSTMAAYVAFCTPGHGAPFRAGGLAPRDDALLSHMRKITEVGVADGLTAAQNAIIKLREEGFAPSMGAPIRDVAHTGQSLYKRPLVRQQ